MAHTPAPVIEPGPRDPGSLQATRPKGRGWRVPGASPADATRPTDGKRPFRAGAGSATRDARRRFIESAMCTASRLAPQAEQRQPRPAASRTIASCHVSAVDDDARPGPMRLRCRCRLIVSAGTEPSLPILYPSSRATFWNQATSGARQINAGRQHQADARTSAHRRPSTGAAAAGRLAEGELVQAQQQRAEGDQQAEHQRGSPAAAARAKVELTTRNSLMKMPSGGRPAMATTPSTRPQPSTGWVSVRPPISAIFCVPLTWAMWPTAKKIADLVSCAWSCAAGRRNWRAARPCRRRR